MNEAMRVAKVKIESWWEVEGGKPAKEIRPLSMNTGLGSRSPGFSKIKVALTKWVSIEGWIHEVHKGHIQFSNTVAVQALGKSLKYNSDTTFTLQHASSDSKTGLQIQIGPDEVSTASLQASHASYIST